MDILQSLEASILALRQVQELEKQRELDVQGQQQVVQSLLRKEDVRKELLQDERKETKRIKLELEEEVKRHSNSADHLRRELSKVVNQLKEKESIVQLLEASSKQKETTTSLPRTAAPSEVLLYSLKVLAQSNANTMQVLSARVDALKEATMTEELEAYAKAYDVLSKDFSLMKRERELVLERLADNISKVVEVRGNRWAVNTSLKSIHTLT